MVHIKVSNKVRDLFTTLKPIIKDKEVLDLGCVQHDIKYAKTRRWLHGFIVKHAKYVLGVDYLQKEVDQLNKKGYNVICADVHNMDIKKKFDVVTAGELIEHLENPGLFINNVRKCLKTGGLFVLTFPNPYALSKIKSCMFKITANPPINPEHTCWFTPDSIGELLRRYSFNIIKAYMISKKGTKQHTLCKIIGGRFQGSFIVIAKKQ